MQKKVYILHFLKNSRLPASLSLKSKWLLAKHLEEEGYAVPGSLQPYE
jgi:hypothetical protein